MRLLSLVENTIHRQILTLTAQSLAMVVRSASSGLEALTWLQSGEEFDLAIIDLDLKKMSGNWLASQIQQRAAQLPLVMFTEREQEANKLNSRINWADRLIKPIQRDQLAAIALSISQDAA